MSIFLEIGPGRGDFLFWLAEQNPNNTMVAVEYKRKRLDKLMTRIDSRGLKNVWLYLGDARKVLPQEFTDSCFDKIYILFSDPWPKRRHAVHRLFRQDFLEEIYRLLTPEGELYVAHDDPHYLIEIKDLFHQNAPRFISKGPWDAQTMTFYAEKWLKEGRTLEFFYYRKIDTSLRDELSLPCANPTFKTAGDLS